VDPARNHNIFLYRRRKALNFDPFDEFMPDGAQLWTRLTPHWRSFVFQELSPETKRLREEALHLRRLRAQENQMNRADARVGSDRDHGSQNPDRDPIFWIGIGICDHFLKMGS
jgi:hypothetical protein